MAPITGLFENKAQQEGGKIIRGCAITGCETFLGVGDFEFHQLSGIYPPWRGGPPSPLSVKSQSLTGSRSVEKRM
jgi:hypothetical protein